MVKKSKCLNCGGIFKSKSEKQRHKKKYPNGGCKGMIPINQVEGRTIMENKKPWMSKTLIANLLVAIVAFFGPEYVEKIPKDSIIMVLASMNMLLRIVTKNKIGLNE